MREIIKSLAAFALCLACVCVFAGCADSSRSPYDEYVSYDEAAVTEFIENYAEKSRLTDDGLIIVTLTDAARQRIDGYTVNDFTQVKAVSVEILSAVGMLFVTIPETDGDGMLRATYILRLRSDVKDANPNSREEPA